MKKKAKILTHFEGKPDAGNTDAKLREKEAELARMQAMLAQMQKQLKMQNDGQQTHQL